MHLNVQNVMAIYEDRHSLWALAPANGALSRCQLPACRQEELEQLTGWRKRFSLLLEIIDVILPLVQNAAARLLYGVHWALRFLLGQGLGIVYKGVRQGMRLQL
eukprot:CAMPEP_0197848334 /NCGR_PEP_ID=MMETSP1438-20131217/8346_1 /TAXON_ID=1461541 /ORGANISM="Pterosperma sp., Strain CCMP1384" /LENGTH=103 /DNA_ID=CAMNT_0043460517 /DNA_START=1 /DNA_END=312 /DNA_ORIENTATION=+